MIICSYLGENRQALVLICSNRIFTFVLSRNRNKTPYPNSI